MRIRSGSRPSSFNDEMQGLCFCSECEKTELRMMDGPVIQGSTRMENEPGNRPGLESGATGGLKVRRKDVSPFRDLTVRDIAKHAQDTVLCRGAAGERHEAGEQQASRPRILGA